MADLKKDPENPGEKKPEEKKGDDPVTLQLTPGNEFIVIIRLLEMLNKNVVALLQEVKNGRLNK